MPLPVGSGIISDHGEITGFSGESNNKLTNCTDNIVTNNSAIFYSRLNIDPSNIYKRVTKGRKRRIVYRCNSSRDRWLVTSRETGSGHRVCRESR